MSERSLIRSRRSFFRAIIAGCSDMPHVGPHPGTGIVLGLVLVTGGAGIQGGGWFGFLFGCLMALAVFGPLYLWGAYDRCRISERLSKEAQS